MAKKSKELSPEQLRKRLGISEATYYRWLRDGRLRGVRVGRRWKFPEAVIMELREDPRQSIARKQDLEQAVESSISLLAKNKVKKKEVERMLETATSDAEAVASMLIHQALTRKAGGLHLEPVADGLNVRQRVHGILQPVGEPLPRGAKDDVILAIKRMAGLDLTVTHLPQDARFFYEFEGVQVNIYCTSFPTELGESLTLRILNPANVSLSFKKTGFNKRLQKSVLEAIKPRSGVFIVNGPTGSGKTTTTYTLLSELNTASLKIMTVEDPVEFLIDGVLQAPLKAPMNFAGAMKVMLRSQVDVGYVGEMRDTESLQLLFQMGATGHKMFTCMHAPDAVGALGRVLDATECAPQMIAENLLGILNQRLIPQSCPNCRKIKMMTGKDAKSLGVQPFEVATNKGCDECAGSGVRGRTAVGELLRMSPGLQKVLVAGERDPDELRKALPQSWPDLKSDIVEHLQTGDITVEHALVALG
ncbi:MAG: GspE/PulE family protein [Planctomycetota bacterium]|jgi:excisionase family DNA binding protein